MSDSSFGRWVDVRFDCLPLRSVARIDVPIDASPVYEAFVNRVKGAITKHGTLNSYYLHQASVTYHLTNDPARGQVRFHVEGTVLTDGSDTQTRSVDLAVRLESETCGWLNAPTVEFLAASARQAVVVEFDRYIAAGDLNQTKARVEANENEADFQAMYL